jgi:hypothetical protein
MQKVTPLLSIGFAFVLLLASIPALAQNGDFFSKFQEANRLDEETELSQSFKIWTQLATENPDNANVNYKAGRSYLNTGSLKSAALPFLEKAAKGKIDPNYDPFSPREKDVPVEVYYYYAKALHLNYKLDKAEEYYEKFMVESTGKHFLYPKADLGREQVDHARLVMKNPVEFEIENLGATINSVYPDYAPVISVDENALFFTSARLREDSSNYGVTDRVTGYYLDDIYVSYKDREGNWQEPERLDLGMDSPIATINVSVDGQTLYVYQADGQDGNIYKTKLVGETWTEPEPMPEMINSKSWETHMAVTPDEQTIYFVSDRKGTLGGRDIFRVKKLPDGKWSKAQNLGDVINTKYDEDAVFVAPDNKTLYFSSEGHNSIGGFDIFYSVQDENGNWSPARNIGYPINTVDDDAFFVTSADGKRAYYSSNKKDGLGEKDIYMISLPDPQEVKLTVLRGTVSAPEGEELPEDIEIFVRNFNSGETQSFTPRQRDGAFVAILPPCNKYRINYTVAGKSAAIDTFSIACGSSYQEINKELLLISGSEDAAIATTSGANQPAQFKKFFGYNQDVVKSEESMFDSFMLALQRVVKTKGEASITILGSASTVPTKTFKNNRKLAQQRADNAKKRILDNADKYGIDKKQLKFTSVVGKVQGPEYAGDAQSGAQKYQKFQYIDIKAE